MFGTVGTPGQAQWWADFRKTDNLERNELFGATLTPGEKQAYAQTTITPGMNAREARANIERRLEIVRNALEKDKEFYLANGYKPEAVEALFAPLSQARRTAEAERQEEAPPAFAAGAGPASPNADPQMPDLRPGAGLDGGDGNTQMGLARDALREDNPTLAGVREEYANRLRQGQTAEQIIRWARSAGIDPSAFPSIQSQVRFRDENPGVPIEQYDTTELDDRVVPLSAVDRTMNAVAGSPAGAFTIGAADAVSAFTLDEIAGAVGGNRERARLGMDIVAQQNPVSSALGTIAGGVGAALTAEAGLARAGVQAGLGRALAADVGFGAAAGAGGAEEGSRLQGAAMGAGAAGAGSLLGNRVGNALGRVARGSNDPAANTLRQEGVNALTVGQTYGNAGRVGAVIKGVEDRLSGVPIIGDAVNAQRTEGLRQFNQAAFRKALEPIGGDVGDKVGYEAIEEAQNQVSAAYTKALAGRGATADDEFGTSLAQSVARVESIPRIGQEIKDSIAEVLRPYSDGDILTGEALDDISRNLRTLKASYIRDPLGNRAANAIDAVERSFFDLFDRQASGTIPEYMAARRAYRRLATLENAVLRAKNQTEQTFTPAQLGQADAANTTKLGGKRAAARGDTPFNELQTAGQAVLPNRVPDSGTMGRLVLPLLALGTGGGADATGYTNGAGMTIGGIIAAAYTPAGRRLLTKPARGMRENTRRRALLENRRTGRAIGASAASGGAALTSDQ
jgi:hypothetical protein